MSIGNVSRVAPFVYSNVNAATSQNANVQNVRHDGSAFAALLQSASGVEGVNGAQGQVVTPVHLDTARTSQATIDHANTAIFGNNGAQFAQLLNNAQGNLGVNGQVDAASLVRNGFNAFQVSASDTLVRADAVSSVSSQVQGSDNVAAEAAQIIGAIESAKAMAAQQVQDNGNSVVELKNKTLDFTAMLPVGMRSLVSGLKCPESELNSFVNEMVFGNANGPQGQNAATYFGSESMTGNELASRMGTLVAAAKINTTDLTAGDYNYVMRKSDAALGDTIAVLEGADLEERSLGRDLEGTFQQDMALMQVLARNNNQSATIF